MSDTPETPKAETSTPNPAPQPHNNKPQDQPADINTAAPGTEDKALETSASVEVPPHAADSTPSLEDMLKAAELKASESHDAWLRAKAEGENIRRRAQEDITKASKFAVEKFADALLPVKDSLEAALANENQSAEALKSGVELTLRQLVSAFEKSSLLDINPVGQKFDPHKHQAISQVDAPEGTEPNTVLTVLQKGYALHDRVVRPALVVVAKAKA